MIIGLLGCGDGWMEDVVIERDFAKPRWTREVFLHQAHVKAEELHNPSSTVRTTWQLTCSGHTGQTVLTLVHFKAAL